MKLYLLFTTVALSGLVMAKSVLLSPGGMDQHPALSTDDGDLHVPGESPMEFCTASNKDILDIEYVNLTPNPPQAGAKLTIEAAGVFKEEIKPGAKIHLQVKYRKYIKLIDSVADLCDQIKNVDLECPLKGEQIVTRDVDLPEKVPPGDYDVRADVYTEDDRKITCLTAQVTFP